MVIPEWGGTAAYNHLAVDLTPFAGSNVFLAYRFDSIDGAFNVYPGVRIDNISVESTFDGAAPAIPEPTSFLLFGLSSIGAGLLRRRKPAC